MRNRVYIAAFLALALSARAQIAPEAAPSSAMAIVIETAPNASIYLDEAARGHAGPDGTFTLPSLKRGKHALRVERAGQKPFSTTFVVTPGKTVRISAPLPEPQGTLEIFTKPQAAIAVNGWPAGQADASGRLLVANLKAVNNEIRVTVPGFLAAERQVYLMHDLLNSVTIDLRPIEAAADPPTAAPPDYAPRNVLVGHTESIAGIAFAADGQDLLSWGWDGRMIVWDPSTGKMLKVKRGGANVVFAVSPDRRYLAMKGAYFATELVDAETEKKIKWLGDIAQTFTPDSQHLLVLRESGGVEQTLILWDLKTLTATGKWQDSTIGLARFSPDGRWLATGRFGVALRDAATMQEVRRLGPPTIEVNDLAFSPDGRWLAVVHGGSIDLWEVSTGRRGITISSGEVLPHRANPNMATRMDGRRNTVNYQSVPEKRIEFSQAAFTPDSQYLATTNSEAIQLWNMATGNEERKWPAPQCNRVAFSPDGQWMAVGSVAKLAVWARTK